MEHIRIEREGAVGTLVIDRRERFNSMDVATARELGWDVSNGVWYLMIAPRGTPAAVIKYLHDSVKAVVEDRDWVSFMWSYPNLIPLDEATVLEIAARVERFAFDRVYGGWWGRVTKS